MTPLTEYNKDVWDVGTLRRTLVLVSLSKAIAAIIYFLMALLPKYICFEPLLHCLILCRVCCVSSIALMLSKRF